MEGFGFDRVYVDEVQDFTQAEMMLLFLAARHGDADPAKVRLPQCVCVPVYRSVCVCVCACVSQCVCVPVYLRCLCLCLCLYLYLNLRCLCLCLCLCLCVYVCVSSVSMSVFLCLSFFASVCAFLRPICVSARSLDAPTRILSSVRDDVPLCVCVCLYVCVCTYILGHQVGTVFLAGDPVQSVRPGVSFRFEEVLTPPPRDKDSF